MTATQQFFSTGISGSGFNISSSGSTHTFNIPIAGTGATGLVSTLAQSFAGTKTFTGDVIVSSTTGSTAFNTGALTVYGGLGVSGQLSFNQAALGYTGATNPSMAFIGSTTAAPITLTVLSDNSLLWEGTSGKLFGINNNLSSGWIFNVGDISGLPIIRANADGTIAMAEFAANVGIGLSNPSYKLHVAGDTNLSSTYAYRINGTSVLSASSLGTGVTNSSLTAVGTITTGVWAGTLITAFYGGTGYNSYTKGDILVGAGSTFIKLGAGADSYVLTANSSSATGLTWSPTAATGLTTLNGLNAGLQYFATGTSGSGFNISSSGSTHTFNIPIAGSGATGLISTLAQTIAGQKTFTSAIIGDLTGTATTAGFAATANYAYQSGYGISSGFATTANYSYQSGYGITSGFATTANYAYQSGYGITAGLATTANYAYQSGYGITSGFATTANYSYQSGYGITAGFATTANYSYQSGYGITAGFATTANYAYQSGYGITAGLATTANYAYQSGYGITAGLATTANYAYQSGYGITSGFATTASYSYQSGYAITSGLATTATLALTISSSSTSVNADYNIPFFSGTALSTNNNLYYNPSTGRFNAPIHTGTWAGNTITSFYGGTGYSSYSIGDLLVGAGSTLFKLAVGTNNFILVADSSVPSGIKWANAAGIAITNINGLTASKQDLAFGYSGTVPAFSSSGSTHTLNIPLAGSGSTGLVSTQAQSFAGIKTFTNAISITDNTGSGSYTSGALIVAGGVGIGGTLNVQGDLNVQGTFTTINSTTITVADKNIELGVVASPSDLTAQGGGITLRGATDKSLNWYSGVGWSSSESLNLAASNTFKINGTNVLSATSLGTGVTNSSLTSLGTITTGVWAGTLITAFYGGTGYNSYTKGDILVGAGSTFIKLNVGTDNYVLTALSTASTGLTWSPTAATGLTTLNGLNVGIQYFATGTSGSGFNISSSGSTHTFNIPIASTGATGLVSTLAQTFTGAKTFDTTLTVSATTPSTNYSSGALIVAGGAGFAGTIYTQTDLNVGNSTTGRLFFSQATLGSAGTTVIPSMAFIGATNSPITLSVLADNSLSFDGSSGQLFSINNNLSSGWIFAVNDISGLPLLRANADGTVAMGEFAGNVGVGLSNPSYKLHVVGDTNLSSGYVYRINGTSVLSATSLGTGVTNSSLTAVGTITTGTWAATAITAFYGGTGYNSYTVGDLLVGAGSTLYKLPIGTNNFVLTADNTAPGGIKWSTAASTGVTTVNSLTSSIQYFATGTSGSGFNISSSGSTHTFNIPIASTGSTGLVSTLAQSFAGIKTFTNDLVISSSTVSTSTSTGALTVTGGVGIGGSLFTGSSTADSISGVVLNNGVITTGSWSATAITAFYGGTGNTSYTLGDLLVGAGSTFIKLPVGINSYVLGADSSRPSGVGWTSVTPLTISDTPPASPKNADLWFNSVDGGLLVYYSDVDTNQWVEIALGSGIDLTQPVHITNTTASTSTTTGALIVDGGAGFASTIYAPVISINGIYDQISSTLTTSSTTVDQVAMSLSSTVYRTLKLNVQMTSSTSYHSQEILMVHDGTLVYMTEYAIVNNGSILSTFDADISGGNIRLLVSPTNAVTTYKIACSAIRI